MSNITSPRILLFGGGFVLLLFVSYGALSLNKPVEKWGVFGDKFGALNCLFTGLASVGVVAALWHERTQSADRDREHREQLQKMKEQTDATLKVLQFEAKKFRLDRLTAEFEKMRKDTVVIVGEEKARAERLQKLRKEITTLHAWFDDLSRD